MLYEWPFWICGSWNGSFSPVGTSIIYLFFDFFPVMSGDLAWFIKIFFWWWVAELKLPCLAFGRFTLAASFDSNSFRFFELICMVWAINFSISTATSLSICSCWISWVLLSIGYFLKKFLTRMSLMLLFLLLLNREEATASYEPCGPPVRFLSYRFGLRRLSAYAQFMLFLA